MLEVIAQHPLVSYVMMHMRGTPQTMQSEALTRYGSSSGPSSVAEDVGLELDSRIHPALESGIEPWRLVVDPGIGFSKTWQDNWTLLRRLEAFRAKLASVGSARLPVLVGVSRKRFLRERIG